MSKVSSLVIVALKNSERSPVGTCEGTVGVAERDTVWGPQLTVFGLTTTGKVYDLTSGVGCVAQQFSTANL